MVLLHNSLVTISDITKKLKTDETSNTNILYRTLVAYRIEDNSDLKRKETGV